MLVMAWPAPALGSPETETFSVLENLFHVRGAASINAALRTLNITESVDVTFSQLDGSGFLILTIPLTAEAKPEAVELAIEGHFFKLRNALLPEDEVRRMRDYTRQEALSELEDPLDHALRHLKTLRSEGRPYRVGDRFDRIARVTPTSIRALVRKYIEPRKRLSAWHRWPSEGQKLPAAGLVFYEEEK
jgi:predicted Zn-dependent peptidase